LLQFAIILAVVALGSTWLVLESAASAIAMLSEAASRGPRLALAWLVGVFITAAVPVFRWLHAESQVAVIGTIGTSLYLVIAGAFAISERDGWPKRFGHLTWLRPGALRSYALVLVLLVVCGVVWSALFVAANGSSRYFGALIAAPSYPLLYLSLAVIAGRTSPLQRLAEPRATRLSFVIVTALGIAGPPLAAVLDGRRAFDRTFNVLNPIIGLVDSVDHRRDFEALAPLLVLTACAALGALAALWRKDTERAL
jgi:small-conductance mechanosensitive channel